ncbi:TIGR03960 family B12-binding radical SAM protein [Oscillospiraceae bacterium OttesenSCG-928-G22]|nr:TIGR03960 family B12-binding radical SAM protein [Oscillospiraceae bacterium OttesenSCG-928-G22]
MIERLESILHRVEKPARYTGGEFGAVPYVRDDTDLRFALCFPDTYEIGMSHHGMRILYGLMNEMPGVMCERVFAPWPDMEAEMRAHHIPLYGLESFDPITTFDVLGFTLQYELSYTNILNMLDLAGLPLRAKDRTSLAPLVIAGGPTAMSAECLAPFVDAFLLGEGEEMTPRFLELLREAKQEGASKEEFLAKAAALPGVYVPSLYDDAYNPDGTFAGLTPKHGAPERVRKCIVKNLDGMYYPDRPIVPSTEIVHDRVMLELFRGCPRGCRFCQAGHIYRPVRRKSPEVLIRQGIRSLRRSGYEEISLTSLSTSDYPGFETLADGLLEYCEPRHTNLSLPSLRADNFSFELMEKIQKVRKSGLTFAPEAGTQRLRDAINKNVREEDLEATCRTAFAGGYPGVKLYFMIGLPTETDEDVAGIADLAFRMARLGKGVKRSVRVTVSASCFVPKAHTPFQWEPQDTMEEFHRKQELLRAKMPRQVKFNWHAPDTSFLEAVFSRGDRRLADVLETAYRMGCKMDGWSEHFHLDRWMEAFRACNIDPNFYATRARGEEERFPWDHIDVGVTREHFWREREKAYESELSDDCRNDCAACGASELLAGGDCHAKT